MIEGNLAQFPVTELVRDLHRREETGVLSLTTGATTTRVYFRRGAIVFADTTAYEQRLGERLLRAGKLRRAELDLACRVRQSSPLRLGTTLVEMGYLTRAELDELLREQVEHIVRSVLFLEAGRFRKELKSSPVEPDLERRDISTLNLLLDAVRSVDSLPAIRRGIGSLDRPVRYVADPRTFDQSVKLTPQEGFVLSRVDASSSAGEIARLSPMGEEQTLRCLWALVAAGILEVEPSASRPAPPTSSSRVRDAARSLEAMLDEERRAGAAGLQDPATASSTLETVPERFQRDPES